MKLLTSLIVAATVTIGAGQQPGLSDSGGLPIDVVRQRLEEMSIDAMRGRAELNPAISDELSKRHKALVEAASGASQPLSPVPPPLQLHGPAAMDRQVRAWQVAEYDALSILEEVRHLGEQVVPPNGKAVTTPVFNRWTHRTKDLVERVYEWSDSLEKVLQAMDAAGDRDRLDEARASLDRLRSLVPLLIKTRDFQKDVYTYIKDGLGKA